jgi:glycosyltransferase involved in cell wall biosynthesis
MRVLHLDFGRQMRGGQYQALYLVEGLSARGHACTLLAREDGALYAEAHRGGLDVRPFRLVEVHRHLREADIVHVHDARGHTFAAIARARPLVVSRRVAFPVGRNPASRWKYAQAVLYLAVSRFVAGRLREAGVPEEKIRVVYDGVPLREPPGRRTRILAPATGDPLKGSALAREAAAAAGVELHFSADLARDLEDAAMLVYITHEEGLGSAVLLALAGGVPVVASRIGGLPEIVEDGRTGLLAGNDAASIAAAIRGLLGDPAAAAAMGARGREAVAAAFTRDHMVEATLAAYREVLSR